MRRCAAVICAVLMTVSVCACGKKTETKRYKMNPTIATTTTTVPTVDYNEEPGKAPLKLTYATSFSDGVAFVRYLDEEGVEHAAAINTAGDILFEMPEEMPMDGDGYKGGIRVVGDVIYDKTGAVIASPEKSGYDSLMTGSCGGYVLAKKVEVPVSLPEQPAINAVPTDTTAAMDTTGTSGVEVPVIPVIPAATLYVGVLNNKGEWLHPLSTEHPIAKAISASAQPAEAFQYVTEDVLRVYVDGTTPQQYYHFTKNTLTPEYDHYVSVGHQVEETAGVYKMAADGSKKLVVENILGDYFFSDAFIGRTVTISIEPGAEPAYGPFKLYDYKGQELMDLGAYPLGKEYAYYVADHLVLPTTDQAGARMLAVLNKEGQPAFEPLLLGMRDVCYPPDESGFVVGSYTADGAVSYRHYDYSGTVTEYSDVTSFAGFFEGLAVATLRGDSLQYYYINHRGEIVLR